MDFKKLSADLENRAFEISARWTGDTEWQKLELPKRLVARAEAIERVYTEFAESRKREYASVSCVLSSDKKCASTPGKKNICPVSTDALENTYFESIRKIGDGGVWHKNGAPKISDDRKTVTYSLKKTGEGSHSGGFSGTVKYQPAYITAAVERETNRARDYLTPLLRSHNLNVTGKVEAMSSPKCLDELERLSRLRKDGTITDNELESMKQKLTSCL